MDPRDQHIVANLVFHLLCVTVLPLVSFVFIIFFFFLYSRCLAGFSHFRTARCTRRNILFSFYFKFVSSRQEQLQA